MLKKKLAFSIRATKLVNESTRFVTDSTFRQSSTRTKKSKVAQQVQVTHIDYPQMTLKHLVPLMI